MAYKNIIGRKAEIKKLEKFLKTTKSEFVAICGRRRVGKSFLVEEVYQDKIVFRAVGSYVKDKDDQTYRKCAGCVVTKDVEPYAVVAGIPARKINERPRDLRYVFKGRSKRLY